MAQEQKLLEAIRYKRGFLEILDQKRLPHESVYVEIRDSQEAWNAIKDMVVRGAPAIAVTAVLALAVEVVNLADAFEGNAGDAASYIGERLGFLVSSRPTAVNLADAVAKLQDIVQRTSATDKATSISVFNKYLEEAEAILAADVVANKAIGEFGAQALLSSVSPKQKLNVLTHCNTGSLATAGYGTALGVIRSLHFKEKLLTAYCTETRPYNQGSRLTAYELVHDRIPAVLIADSAAASLLASGKVDAIVVGADRVAANGDTANKIGTLNLALVASKLGIPFFIAAPVTTLDTSTASGDKIAIEERAHKELTHANGGSGPEIAAPGIKVWNPAFDVTPGKLIAAIITDIGVIWQDKKRHFLDVVQFLQGKIGGIGAGQEEQNGFTNENGTGIAGADQSKENGRGKQRDYRTLNEEGATEYLSNVLALAKRLGGTVQEWEIKEVGDGNLNYVYIVVGPNGSLVLKQALPYVRCVGESWPMTLERSYFEYRALKKAGELAPGHVPEVYHFDHPMAVIAMRYLEPPHIILRKGLIKGLVYPHLADHISTFLSKTLFHTSLLALSTAQHKDAVIHSYGNLEMCRLTEQVIFTEPYQVASNNRWTSPQLDDDARAIREDDELKLEIAELKSKFCSQTQALIHGDLHTGSIMVTETSTQVIDPEFSFYGPSGFDIGAFLGNMILAYYSQDGHCQLQGDRNDYKRWILTTISDIWTLFQAKFRAEWDGKGTTPGDAYVSAVYATESLRDRAKSRYLIELFHDTLGFAGAKIIRRIVGIAHVEDLESISDVEKRAAAERSALNAGKFLMKRRKKFETIAQVLDFLAGN